MERFAVNNDFYKNIFGVEINDKYTLPQFNTDIQKKKGKYKTALAALKNAGKNNKAKYFPGSSDTNVDPTSSHYYDCLESYSHSIGKNERPRRSIAPIDTPPKLNEYQLWCAYQNIDLNDYKILSSFPTDKNSIPKTISPAATLYAIQQATEWGKSN